MDSAIAERLQEEAELQVAAVAPALLPIEVDPEPAGLTREPLDFLRGRTWMRAGDGQIIVLYSGTIRGKIPRGITCRPQTSAARSPDREAEQGPTPAPSSSPCWLRRPGPTTRSLASSSS
jgi:hypothetical protein